MINFSIFKLNKLDECIEDCSKAIELDESYIKAYARRAKSYMDKEDYESAVNDYEKVYKLDKTKGKCDWIEYYKILTVDLILFKII